ncbi:MAG: hypothetical protein OXF43_05970, partial [Gammaproteobacteria bacterium]|nr:hypothetical protein [Gammaproteobacteria bacterium]
MKLFPAILLAFASALAWLPASASAAGWDFLSQPLDLPAETTGIVLADLDGDARREIIAVVEN